jgi:hypothetical protein
MNRRLNVAGIPTIGDKCADTLMLPANVRGRTDSPMAEGWKTTSACA